VPVTEQGPAPLAAAPAAPGRTQGLSGGETRPRSAEVITTLSAATLATVEQAADDLLPATVEQAADDMLPATGPGDRDTLRAAGRAS
jgi:hypothetical protein